MLSLTSNTSLVNHSIPLIYLADYTTGKYLIASKTSKMVLGYDDEEFIHGGLGLTADLYKEEDLALYNKKIFPDRLKILQQIPAREHSKYVFSYNFRLKNKSGNYVTLLQRNCFIKSDNNGSPLLSFGMVMNVSHYVKENPVIQVVEKADTENYFLPAEPISKKAYYLHEEDSLLTNREKEVLLWLTDGLTSKQVADKLFISEHTVINHRKNMMLKTGVSNVSELISFALKTAII